MAIFQVHFRNAAHGIDTILPCRDDQTLLEAAEAQGLALPYSCRSAACGTCAGRVLSGKVVLDEQYILGDRDLERGFTCLCSATPASDVEILTHQRDEVEGV